jgi:hypothetical protein
MEQRQRREPRAEHLAGDLVHALGAVHDDEVVDAAVGLGGGAHRLGQLLDERVLDHGGLVLLERAGARLDRKRDERDQEGWDCSDHGDGAPSPGMRGTLTERGPTRSTTTISVPTSITSPASNA